MAIWYIFEIQGNLRRKKHHETNQGSNFLEGRFNNRDDPNFNLKEKVNPSILKDYFSSRKDPSIFTSIAPMLLDPSNETSWIFPALIQQSTSCPSPVTGKSKLIYQTLDLPDLITLRAESSIIIIDSYNTNNIIRKVINVYYENCRTKNAALGNSNINRIFILVKTSHPESCILLRKEEIRPNIWPEIP